MAATVPSSFVQGMLTGARRTLGDSELAAIVRAAGIEPALLEVSATRFTRQQFVRVYAGLALGMGDEMLGLWSRPIRAGTLKYLGLSLLDAPSLLIALYRFTRFWNLLLDDHQLHLSRKDKSVTISLRRRAPRAAVTVFGHELMIKLVHGLASWLAGRALPIEQVGFGFPKPGSFADYAALFPEQVIFVQHHTYIRFPEQALWQRFRRGRGELLQFVRRAPDDWIFSTFDHASVTQQVRVFVASRLEWDPELDGAAQALHVSNRTLSRKLATEGATFRDLKNGVRRDNAIERLMATRESLAGIAAHLGFDNLSAFHRAFKSWTGSTPRAYRQQTSLMRQEIYRNGSSWSVPTRA